MNPQRGPYGEKYPLIGHFTSQYISFNFPLDSPVRDPPPYSLTGSPWTVTLHHQSHWSTFLSFICVCLPESPKRSLPTYIYGEKHEVLAHGAPHGRKAYMQWGVAWFPKGIVNDIAVSTPVPCSLRHDTFHLGLGKPEPR